MKTLRKLIYGETFLSIALVTFGFLTLFTFFDLVDELQNLGRSNPVDGVTYQMRHALLYVTLLAPSRLYELLPISVLIGTIFVMARLAQSSEYTILRTSGLDPWRALRLLLTLGSVFVALAFAVGDYVAPAADKASQLLKARYLGRITIGQTGAWLRERQDTASYVVNVRALTPNNTMQGIEIHAFDPQGRMKALMQAREARFADEAWVLEDVQISEVKAPGPATSASGLNPTGTGLMERKTLQSFKWDTAISGEMVAAALLRPDRMGTIDLFSYIRHLKSNGQNAQRYEIEFWKKVFYPLSCLVMVMLALPFAYLHMRSGGISGYVFAGVMIGISFFLMNNLAVYMGNLQQWQPWLAAALPGLLYTSASMAAFGWLVLRR
ncbi:MAG: LPS export ABC transporter permease LptG [Betaproteobacteria bacterium]|nr:LPS export ABC transporter permease LptG [Betaproteobacteria bacterium]